MAVVVDYVKLEECGKRFLAVDEICSLLSYDEKEFRAEMTVDPLINQAIKRGRALAIEAAAKVVETSYSTSVCGSDKEEFQLKAALALLDRQAAGWRKAK